jgi:hypothetical protein
MWKQENVEEMAAGGICSLIVGPEVFGVMEGSNVAITLRRPAKCNQQKMRAGVELPRALDLAADGHQYSVTLTRKLDSRTPRLSLPLSLSHPTSVPPSLRLCPSLSLSLSHTHALLPL